MKAQKREKSVGLVWFDLVRVCVVLEQVYVRVQYYRLIGYLWDITSTFPFLCL